MSAGTEALLLEVEGLATHFPVKGALRRSASQEERLRRR